MASSQLYSNLESTVRFSYQWGYSLHPLFYADPLMVALLGMGADKNLFLAHILKYINDMAFKLDASVPLARRGLFGLSGRKELWIFKGSETWWTRK
jgi:hypothetical protein